MQPQKTLNSHSNLEKKKNVSDITLLNIKLYKSIVLETAYYWYKYRHIDQWKTIESRYKTTPILSINR